MIQLARHFEERPDVRYGLTAMLRRARPGWQRHLGNPHYTGKKK